MTPALRPALLPGWIAALLLLMPVGPARVVAQTFPAGSVTTTVLPNGLRIVNRSSSEGPLVTIALWVHAGSRDETPANNGTAHLLEHYLFQGKASGLTDPFDRTIEGLGGTLNAETERDHTHFYVVVPSEKFGPALKALAAMLLHPSFDPTQLEIERRRAGDEVARRLEDPVTVLRDALYRLAYAVSPYRLPAAGTPETISKLSIEQVQGFYNEFYRPDNTTLVVVGGVADSEVKRSALDAFGSWRNPPGALPEVAPEPERTATPPPAFIALKPGASEALVGVAFPAPSARTGDSAVMDVIFALLTTGQRSLLQRDAGGLLSDVGSDFLTSRDPGLFLVWGDAPISQVREARERVQALVGGLSTGGFSAADLARARMSLLGSYTLENETTLDQATSLGFYDSVVTADYAVRYDAAVQSVTRADVERVAGRYFRASYTVVMGPPGTRY